ncbi:MAG: hypothetical protein A3J63_04195 [Candidatus Moranbacteria bacterium RIFCSPHIGHO2_02_FULL_40_12b]|nr:MAG: hypothetical protein A3J63_04195 [Candidatus Moranbacteria bacterium RIFCSPHIGHO2_02_FULL_40_12b]OGI23152.1 MAG: hypothetical protein A3E91_03035 [Candidatus Moranbacteria bacterium RIFCSPHIGHO2_12_FULL_40_10]
MKTEKENYIYAFLRIAMGWIFLWPFWDKIFGLGYSTMPGKAWINGVSPTTGFLMKATKGPFKEIFQGLAGSAFVDWLFMAGLVLIGLALMLGILVKLAAYSGSVMFFLMWLAALPPERNPIIDEHIIYILIILALAYSEKGYLFSISRWWSNTNLVKKFPIFK